MTADVLLLALGLVLLVGGGDVLVRGASALARQFGVSPLVIGLTVVAFGTSAPELAVNVTAALHGNGELSFGNIVGSNIANIGLVVGFTALIKPVRLHRGVITREIPMMALASVAALVMALDVALSDAASEGYDRGDGFLLLLLFCVFLYYTTRDALGPRREDEDPIERDSPRRPTLVNVTLTLVGFAALIGGGSVTVGAATEVARAIGLSEAVIGMTIVAVGTSLPELVTSVVSVLRGQTDLAVGNVVGSNIFNLLFVLGVTATIEPVPIPAGGHTDLLLATALAAALLPLSINPGRHVLRWGGLVLFGTYAGYLAWRTIA